MKSLADKRAEAARWNRLLRREVARNRESVEAGGPSRSWASILAATNSAFDEGEDNAEDEDEPLALPKITVAEAASLLRRCPFRCSTCPSGAPGSHHWMIDLDDDGPDDEPEHVRLGCRYCDAAILAPLDDPNLPEI